MSLVRNERTKLLAMALNNIAAATFITGLIGPAASFLYGMVSPTGSHPWPFIACCWFFGSVILHLAGQLVLGRLVP